MFMKMPIKNKQTRKKGREPYAKGRASQKKSRAPYKDGKALSTVER
jgi:hypothetical protein